jgi:hypothetical protein
MTATSNTFRPHTSRTRRDISHPWRDIGIGLAVVTIVASMSALGAHEQPRIQPDGLRPGVGDPALSRGWDESVPPDLFPLGALSGQVAP